MKIHTSGKDYLEAVLMLQRKVGIVRSVDPARHIFQKLKAKDQKVGERLYNIEFASKKLDFEQGVI